MNRAVSSPRPIDRGFARPDDPSPISVALPTGTLEVKVRRAELPLDELCGFAARRNPKRGFLFVSRVLGRHLPVRPSVMRDVHRRLALKLPADLPGPVVMIGLAETAIALGRGVFEEYAAATGREDVLFLQSTRYHLRRPVAFRFSEEHSHASAHLVYRPEDPRADELLRTARTLVVIDDEASTGKTFANIASAFRSEFPSIEQLGFVVITDWRDGASREVLHDGLFAHSASLLEGEYAFTSSSAPPLPMPKVVGTGEYKDSLLTRNDGRFGVLAANGSRPVSTLTLSLSRERVPAGGRVLVLGTGEFVYPPYQLAAQLERQGADVWCQATTRSPALVGDAIGSALEFVDNCGDGIPNYVYNVRPGDYDRVLLCYETPPQTAQGDLLRALGAEAVFFP